MLIDCDRSVVVLVDYQERLMPAISGSDRVIASARGLARCANLLGIPVIGTEQNPEGLGPNVAVLRDLCAHCLPKQAFDATAAGLAKTLETVRPNATQVIVAGCESHVCLLQTALGLIECGLTTWIVTNACGSRRESDRLAAMARLARHGAELVTAEMVIFEWLRHCAHPRWREALAIVKSMPLDPPLP